MALDILKGIDSGNVGRIVSCLEEIEDVTDYKKELEEAVFASVVKKNVEILKHLVKFRKINLDYIDPTFECSALGYLCMHPDKNCPVVEEMAELLLEHRANMDQKDKYGNSMMILALMHDQSGVLRLLIQYLADMLAKNRNGETVFYLAAQTGRLTELSWLYGYSLRFGYDLDLYYLKKVAQYTQKPNIERYLETLSRKGEMYRASILQFMIGVFFMCIFCVFWDENKGAASVIGFLGAMLALPEIPNVLNAKLSGYAISAKLLGPKEGEMGYEAYDDEKAYLAGYFSC